DDRARLDFVVEHDREETGQRRGLFGGDRADRLGLAALGDLAGALGESGTPEDAAAERARWRASVASWAAWRLAGSRPPRRASASSIEKPAATRTASPSTASASAAVTARVAAQPSESKLTESMRPSAMDRER